MRGFILTVAVLIGASCSLPAATTIRDDPGGIIVFHLKEDHTRLDKPLVFRLLTQTQAYYNPVTPSEQLIHIETDRVVKVAHFINPSTFPTKFGPEDLATLQAKIDELQSLGSLSPDAARLAASHLQYLRNVLDVETVRYKQSAGIAAQKFNSDEEKAAFDKKCDLMNLALQASKGDIQQSEQIVKQMEPLAPRSEMLTGVLAKWNQEKSHALQLSGECGDLWAAALKSHPECFKPVDQLADIPDYPPDLKEKFADLQLQLDQFRNSVSFPQILLYCKKEVPALFLLNQIPPMVEKIKALQYKDASEISQKALQQVHTDQIEDPYKPVYATFKNYSDLVDDIRLRFFQQVTKAQTSEDSLTNRELLIEYQKAYDLIPDPAIAAKIEALKAKIKEQ